MPKPGYNMELNKPRVMRELVHLGKYIDLCGKANNYNHHLGKYYRN